MVTITVDAHRYHELKMYTITPTKGYANISVNGKNMPLGRYLMDCTDSKKHVDHKDRDPTNYQINNLRIVTPEQNEQNKSSKPGSSSRYVGVTYNTDCNKWQANIKYKKTKQTSIHVTEYMAAMVRDMYAYKLNLLGNLFNINLPDELQSNLFIKSLSENSFDFNYLFY